MTAWTVVVTGPSGQTDSGALTIVGEVKVAPERIAETLADIVWRIAIDMARAAEGDEG